MKRLHDDLDHDDDGNVSLIEGAQVFQSLIISCVLLDILKMGD